MMQKLLSGSLIVAMLAASLVVVSPTPALADCTVSIDSGHTTLEGGFGYAASDGSGQYADSFTAPCSGTISSITMAVNKIGSPIDSPQTGIQNDSGGFPSNTYLQSATFTVSQTNPTCTGTQTAAITAVSVTSGTKYWIVWSRTGALNSTNRYGLCGTDGTGTDGASTAGTTVNTWNQVNIHVYATLTIVAAAAGTPPSIIGLIRVFWW